MTLIEKVRDNWWLLRTCRDWSTVRAMKLRGGDPTSSVRTLRFRAIDEPVLYRPGTSDISVAWELFQTREYACREPWEFASVVDCGANVGMFLAFALMETRGKLGRYVGVEADRAAFRVLERQVNALGIRDRCRLIEAAAWEHDGEVRFDDRGPSWARHVSSDGGARVRALCIPSILDEAGLDECDLLKLDIEGGEKHVLPRMKEWGPRVKRVVAEMHGECKDYAWFERIAKDAGFVPFPEGTLFHSHPSAVRRDVFERASA